MFQHGYSRLRIKIGLFIGICLIVGGIGYRIHSIIHFRNWDEVTAQCTDTDCKTYQGKSGKEVSCTVRFDYSYNGERFSTVVRNHPPTNNEDHILYVNPQHPEQPADRLGDESKANYFILMGLLISIVMAILLYFRLHRNDDY